MEFPIATLMDTEHCTQWIIDHFHPNGFGCPRCGAGIEQARKFRREKGENHDDPDDPPRQRANQRPGRGTYDNDRPPIVGTVGWGMCHSQGEYARDDDGDGIREVHVNTTAGLWTDVRNFLSGFKGVHKDDLNGDVAIFEFWRHLKRITTTFISSSLVSLYTSCI